MLMPFFSDRDEIKIVMDEEAANLVMYQSAYQASAKVMSVTNELMSNLLNLV